MTAPFAQLVFSGGGTRCFWQGGFLHALSKVMDTSAERVCGVSGGALSAACHIARTEHDLLNNMQQIFRRQGSHIAWDTVAEDGLTPHQRLYREAVERTLTPEALSRIAAGPLFQILVAHPPTDRAPRLTGTLVGLVYEAEKQLRSTPHLAWCQTLAVEKRLVDARAAAGNGTLIDLVCAAATIPPVFATPMWDGRPVIDAGMTDQAPMPDPDRGRTLVLLTRTYRNLPDVEGRIYAAPSESVEADKIDFTDPEKIERTWVHGESDGRAFLEARAD